MKAPGIYAITNTLTGDMYIGSSVNVHTRLLGHRRALTARTHSNRRLQAAWNKYGASAFEFALLTACSREVLRAVEQQCLDELRPAYNLARSVEFGMLGLSQSAETRARISVGNRGKVRTDAQRSALSNALTGRKLSDETRAKMSAARRGVKRPPMSAQQRAKLRAANLGKTHNVETRAKISDAARGRTMSAETRSKLGESIRRAKRREREPS